MKRTLLSFMLAGVMSMPMYSGLTVNAYTSDADYRAAAGAQAIPFADYPAGSYFTDNGQPCTDHKSYCSAGASYFDEDACNCKCTWEGVPLNSTSCYGFANMVYYRLFGHTTYSNTKKVVSNIPASKMSYEYLYDLFTNGTVKAGAHIRNSTHSMVFMGCDTEYIYTYEGNFDGQCQVGVIKRTWDEMITYLKSKNGIKFIDMPVNYPETVASVPANGWIYKSKVKIAVGEEISFNYNAKDAKNFFLGIDKVGKGRVRTVNAGASDWYTTTFEEPGTYTIYASCYNVLGHTDTFIETFTVYDRAPENIEISAESLNGNSEYEVTFKFSSDYATDYMFAIRNEDTGLVDTVNAGDAENYTMKFKEPGQYSVCVTGANKYGSCTSNEVDFIVYNSAEDTAENLMNIIKRAVK